MFGQTADNASEPTPQIDFKSSPMPMSNMSVLSRQPRITYEIQNRGLQPSLQEERGYWVSDYGVEKFAPHFSLTPAVETQIDLAPLAEAPQAVPIPPVQPIPAALQAQLADGLRSLPPELTIADLPFDPVTEGAENALAQLLNLLKAARDQTSTMDPVEAPEPPAQANFKNWFHIYLRPLDKNGT